MNHDYLSCLVLITTAVLGILLALIWWYRNFSNIFRDLNKIPGPRGLPILGNVLELLVPRDQLFQEDRARSVKYFPIYKQSLVTLGVVNILLPEDIELVLSNSVHNRKSKLYELLHSWLGTGLLTSGGTKWQIRRKTLTPAFHFNILKEFVGVFNEGTTNLVETVKKIERRGDCDIGAIITDFTLDSIVRTSMGINLGSTSSESGQSYKKAVHDFGQLVTYRMVRPWLHSRLIFNLTSRRQSCKQVVKTLHDFSRNVIEERKKSHSDNNGGKLAMLDLLLNAQKNGADIDDEGIREEVDTFMFEGHDTTSSALCSMFFILAQHKQVQDLVYQEIVDITGTSDTLPTFTTLQQLNYTERCLKECLRLYPPVPFIARTAGEDIATSTGYKIPQGTMIHIHIFDVHRNPEIFPDPEKFDPDRFLPENTKNRNPFAYIPFSAGSRNCIGQRFALVQIKAVLCGVLKEFEIVPGDDCSQLVFMTDLVLRTKNCIRVRFVPRNK